MVARGRQQRARTAHGRQTHPPPLVSQSYDQTSDYNQLSFESSIQLVSWSNALAGRLWCFVGRPVG